MTDSYASLCEIIREELGADALALEPETELDDVPGWDSVTLAGVLMELEERFAITVDRRRIEHVRTVRDLAALAEV